MPTSFALFLISKIVLFIGLYSLNSVFGDLRDYGGEELLPYLLGFILLTKKGEKFSSALNKLLPYLSGFILLTRDEP